MIPKLIVKRDNFLICTLRLSVKRVGKWNNGSYFFYTKGRVPQEGMSDLIKITIICTGRPFFRVSYLLYV